MKGVIFRSFFTYVQDNYGEELLEEVIEKAKLTGGGAYTTVGTYDVNEMISLVVKLSETVGTDVPELLSGFGHTLFSLLVEHYPAVVEHCQDSFTVIASIDDHIHVQVKKLYPDADLPRFVIEQAEKERLVVRYQSIRGFADLAEGLFRGCFKYFDENVELEMEDFSDGAKTDVKFTFRRRESACG